MALTKATQNVLEGIVSTGSTGPSAGSFIVGQQYKITSLGTTTQLQWNTIAGTAGQTYVVGSLFTAATIGASSGNGAVAVARTLANRFADVVNVKDFGAVGNGVADDSPAFAAAIFAAVGSDALDNSFNIQFPLCVTIYVPAGNYLLGSIVNVWGKDVTYILSHGASFSPTTPLPYTGTNRLNGRVVRDGLHFSANHFGIKDKAGTLSIHGFTAEGYDEGAFINGFANPFQLADVLDRDSCTLVVSNRNPAPYATITTANYTSTTIVPAVALTSDEVKLLKVGMTIDTLHATKYSGFVTSWANNGSSITVSGWFQQGNQSAGQVPPNGFGALVQNFTKVFSQNNLVWLDRGVNKATRCAGFELDLHNNRSSPGATDPSGNTNTDYLWAFDAAATGQYQSTVAYLARGPFQQAFHAVPQSLRKTTGSSYNRVSTTVTVTSTAHGLANNDIIKISAATDSGLNGYQTVTVTGLNTFTFTSSSVGTASGTLDWECKDYSGIGFLYGGNGIGFKFDNYNANQGLPIEINNVGSVNPTFKLFPNGLAETKEGFTIVKTSGDSIFYAETGAANAMCRLKTATNNWSLVSWNAGHFSIYEQSTFIEKLKVDAGYSTDPIWVYVNGTLKQVTEGAANSGGTGFKVLRVAN